MVMKMQEAHEVVDKDSVASEVLEQVELQMSSMVENELEAMVNLKAEQTKQIVTKLDTSVIELQKKVTIETEHRKVTEEHLTMLTEKLAKLTEESKTSQEVSKEESVRFTEIVTTLKSKTE